ncbi:MAG: hypothetical protein C0418_00405 [Coriobacteriaceae bacterium]|nr:hypothetical protein [Coriobacteriaceae bacterium]
MDYVGILKKAWNVTWRHKALWMFGFLAGSSGGSSYNTGSNYRSSSGDLSPQLSQQYSVFENWFAENLALLAVLVGLLVMVAIVFWVLSVMAHAALVHQVNEAEEGRPVSISAGFSAGFRYWGRTFLIFLALGLPILVLALLFVALMLVAIVPLAQAEGGGDALAALPLLCGGGIVVFVLLLVVGFVVGILQHLALRYAILEERPAFDAIGAAWGAMRSRFKDVLIMWLLMLAVGAGYGLATGLLAIVLVLPAVLLLFTGNIFGFLGLILVLAAIMVVPSAIWGAFISAAWTVFFRRLTGREIPAAAAAPWAPTAPPAPEPPAYPPPPPAYIPPPPPPPVYPVAGYEPPAPPEAPAEPAPDAPAEDSPESDA